MAGKSARRAPRSQKRAGSRKGILLTGLLLAVAAVVVVFAFRTRTAENSPPEVRPAVQARPPVQTAFEVVASYPHDPSAFVQGLVWHDGVFYESTGLEGESALRKLEFPSGKVLRVHNLAPELFGEGLARVGNRLVQLTWKSRRGFVYDLATFDLVREFGYEGEGWGLTFDGRHLIMSDGTSVLRFLDPETFEVVRRLQVTSNGTPVHSLNELEYIKGEIWSNVWQSESILRIDPSTGHVTSYLNLRGILTSDLRTGREDVLNGIAYDPASDRIFVTGKLWPRVFEIRLR